MLTPKFATGWLLGVFSSWHGGRAQRGSVVFTALLIVMLSGYQAIAEKKNREELIERHQSLLEASDIHHFEPLKTQLETMKSQRLAWESRCEKLINAIILIRKEAKAVCICKYRTSAILSRHRINSQQPLIQKRFPMRLKRMQLSAQLNF